MKQHRNILILGLTLGLFACNSSADKQENIEKSASVDSISLTNTQTTRNISDSAPVYFGHKTNQ